MLWLGAHFPGLPMEVFATPAAGGGPAASPHSERGIPRVVIEDNRVIRCNPAAAAARIVPGTSLATAHSIVPALVHHTRNPTEEARRLRRLAVALYRLSPQVSLAPPDSVVLEIGASLRLFGGAEPLIAEATALCRALGHETAWGTAPTPLAALTLARTGAATLDAAPLRFAAIEPEHLPPAVVEQLANMGVHTVGQLQALPAAGLAARFGQGLVDYLQRLCGEQPDPRRYLLPPARFRQHVHLLSAIHDKEVLLAPMARLLTELEHWLTARQLGVEQILWQFTAIGRGAEPVFLRVHLSTAQQRQTRLLAISRLQLERSAVPEEVISLALSAERLRPWQGGNQALFRYLAPGAPARAEPVENGTAAGVRLTAGQAAELGELVDRLEARLGRGTCWSLQVRDQHVPEDAWQRVAPLRSAAHPGGAAVSVGRPVRLAKGVRRTGTAPELAAAHRHDSGRTRRPVWLFVPPRAVRPEQLSLLRGPERIDSGWWRIGQPAPSPASKDRTEDTRTWRDYYVARHENGAECWVFQDAATRWYLHGYFG
jgi:protein ImuB